MKFKRIAVVLVCALLLGVVGSVVPTMESPSPPAQAAQGPAETESTPSAETEGPAEPVNSPRPKPAGTPAPSAAPTEKAPTQAEKYCTLAAARFADVEETQWFAEAVGALAAQGVIEEGEDGLFRPQDFISRAEFLQLLANLSGKDLTAREERNTFSDVLPDSWYAPYICWSVKEKILTGREDDTFDPDGPVSRQEMAVILYRFNKNVMGKRFPQEKAAVFQDASDISDWAAVEVNAVERAGLMGGFEDGSFRPRQVATRAETAQILYRYSCEYQEYQRGCSVDELRYITHGGGKVEDLYPQSNSIEALQETYNWGNRVIELDFSWTSDDQLACVHNWGGSFPALCTLEDFLSTKIYGKLSPMGVDELAQWLKGHPDASVVMDFKERSVEGLQMIADRYPELLDQFFPYIFHTEEYELVRAMGYCNIMLFLTLMPSWEKDYTAMAEFAREKELVGIVIEAKTEAKMYAPAKQAGIPVIPYTVNDEAKMYELSQQGADGFFTDMQDAMIIW